jgi:hypothetical protein
MIIADTNEFHPLMDGKLYRESKEPDGSDHPIIIMRATYGTVREDHAYVSNLIEARKADLLVGHYGYMVAGVDAHNQGIFFAVSVKAHGGVKPGDTIWCDAEEGSGDQSHRVDDFLSAAHGVLHDTLMDEGVYSGKAFWVEHLGNLPSSNALRWVAAYGQAVAPKIPGQDLWQFTDNEAMAGIKGPCDASIFNGNLEDFKKLVDPPASHNGPYRHVVKITGMSLDTLTTLRKTSIDHVIQITKENVDKNHYAILNAYLQLRNVLLAIGEPSPAMPLGFVYWTSSP